MSRDGGVDYTQLDADAEVTVSVRTKKYLTEAAEAITGQGVLKKDLAYFKITTAGEGLPTQTFKENLNCSLGLVLFNLLDEDEYAVLIEVLTSTNAPCQLQGAEEQLMPLEKRNSLREKFINIDFNQSKSINLNLSIDFDDINTLVSLLEVSLLELEKTRLDLPQYDVTEEDTEDTEDTKAMVVSILSKINNNNNVLKYAISSDSTSNAVTTEEEEDDDDIENPVDKISDETIDGKIGSAFIKQLAVLNAEAKHSIKNGCTVNIFEKLGLEGSVCEKSRDGRVLVLAPVAKDVAGEIIYREATAEDNLDDTVVINIDNTTKHEHSLRSSLIFSNIASGLMVALRTHNISMLRPDNLQSVAFPLLHLPEMLKGDLNYMRESYRSDHNSAPTKSKALAIVIKYINISVATTKGGDYVNCMPWVNLIIEIGIKYLETCTSAQTIQANALEDAIKKQTDPSSSMQTNHNDSIKGAMGELFEGGIATIASCVMIEGQIDSWINNGKFAKYISMTQQSFTSPYTLIPGILIACASAICAYFKFFVGNATSSLKADHIKNLHFKMKEEGGALRSISNFTEKKPSLSAFVSFIGSLSEPMKDFLLLSTMFQQWLQKNDYSEQKQEQYAQYFYWPLISVVFILRFIKEFYVAFKPVQALSGYYIPFDNEEFYRSIGFEADEISNIQGMTTTFSVKQAGEMIIKRVHGKLRELNSRELKLRELNPKEDTPSAKNLEAHLLIHLIATQIAAITTQWFAWKRKNGYFCNYLTNNTPCLSVNKIEMCFLELRMYLKSAFNSIIEIDRLLTPFLMFCTYSYAAHEGSEFAINSLLNSMFADKRSPTSDMMHHASTLLISFCIIRAAADAAVVVKAQFDGFREDDIRGKTSGHNGKTTPKSILFNDIIDSLRHKDPKNIIYALGFIKSCIAFEAFPGIMTLLGQTENAKELVLITSPDNAGTLIAFGAFFAPLMFKMLGTAGGKDAKAVESTLKQYRPGVESIIDLYANSLLIQAFNSDSYTQTSDTLRDDSSNQETRVAFSPSFHSRERTENPSPVEHDGGGSERSFVNSE